MLGPTHTSMTTWTTSDEREGLWRLERYNDAAHLEGLPSGVMMWSMTSPMTGFSHVQLLVSDVRASEQWYTTVLGMDRFAADDSVGYVALRHKPSGVVIVLSTRASGNRDESALDHLAFAVPDGPTLETGPTTSPPPESTTTASSSSSASRRCSSAIPTATPSSSSPPHPVRVTLQCAMTR